MRLAPRIKLLLAGLLFLTLAVPITLSLVKTPQETRSRASGGTNLFLIPQPGPESSIEKTVGNTVPVDLMVDPGTNAVTLLRVQIKYDPTKLEPVNTSVFTPTVQFPTVLEGPIANSGTVSVVLSVGSDVTKAIRTVTKVGTFNFKAIASTPEGTPTQLSFSNLTQAYSSGSNDQSAENILASTSPASVTIFDAVMTPTATTTLAPTPTLAPGTTILSLNVLLHGIGAAGDTPNPTGNSLSNKNPRNIQRNLTLSVYDANDQLVKTATGTLVFDNDSGTFKGQVSLGDTFSTGSYTVKIKSDRYLRRSLPGIVTIARAQDNILPQMELVAGDTDGDNSLNVLDYNALLDCGYGALTNLPISNSSADYNSLTCKTHDPRTNIDIDDNGFVNAFDYNLFLRELSVQSGD